MRPRRLTLAVSFLTCLFVATIHAQSASFQPLGLGPGGVQSLAWDVTPDGSVVVGNYWVPSGSFFIRKGFRWVAGDFQDIGTLNPNAHETQPFAVSDDGTKIVGWSRGVSGSQRPFLWTAGVGMQELSNIPGSDAVATDISHDGTVIVGYFLDTDGDHAFRWVGGVVTDLGFLPGGRDSKAQAVCGNGGAIVGSTLQSNFVQRAFRWRPSTGMQNLGALRGDLSYAEDCSDDGSFVAGSGLDDKGNLVALRWDPKEIRSLGALGGNSSEAHAISADGSVVIGSAGLPFVNGISEFSAFRWTTATKKMEQLSRLLENLGVTTPFCHQVPCAPGTWFIQLALGVSPNGNVIVGDALGPDDHWQAFRAIIGPSAPPPDEPPPPPPSPGTCSSGFTQVTLNVKTAAGAAAGTVESNQTGSDGSKLTVSSGETKSKCFESNKTLGFQALNNRLADWSGSPAINCKDGNISQNRCEFQLGTTTQNVTSTLK